MKKNVLLIVAICLVSAAIAQNKKQNKHDEKLCITQSCCQPPAGSNGANTDANFMAVASTKDFGSLHEEPLPFTFEDQKGSMISYPCTDGAPAQAYFISSKSNSNNYLIVIQEWWGLNDHIKKEAEKFYEALGGQVNVIAVDLYDGKVAATVDSAQKLIRAALSTQRKETILQGALEYTGKQAHIYTVGWCFGGMMSLQTAIMSGAKMKGCIMYYGTPEKDPAKIEKIDCDVLGIFGTKDKSIPNESVDKFAADMKSAGKNFILHRYDAAHAFANPSNPGYSKEFGDDAFEKSVEFLKERLK